LLFDVSNLKFRIGHRFRDAVSAPDFSSPFTDRAQLTEFFQQTVQPLREYVLQLSHYGHSSWEQHWKTDRDTSTTTFETFPFSWPPGKEPKDDPRVDAITAAPRELEKKRDAWLNPSDASAAELKKTH